MNGEFADTKELLDALSISLTRILKKMAGISPLVDTNYKAESNEIFSRGITSIINFSGKANGRIMIDMPINTALSITKKITGNHCTDAKNEMVMSTVSELNNIVAGDVLTVINNKYSSKLRLIPPIVFTGEETMICLDKIDSESFDCSTDFGNIRANVALEGSDKRNG